MSNLSKPEIRAFNYRAPRLETDFHIWLQVAGPENVLLQARCMDFSEKGLAMELAAPLELNSEIRMIVSVPGISVQLPIIGRVQHQSGTRYGIVFLPSSKAERACVGDLAARLHSGTICL
ncbi:MAG TPA: PilZ domain-containing protein [Terriglobales bacterium]|nr:PilZ domain-containing protein [Terriglobales bacterium]